MPKHFRRVQGFDAAILSLYAKGLTTGEIQAHLAEIYDVDASYARREFSCVVPELGVRLKVGRTGARNWPSRVAARTAVFE